MWQVYINFSLLFILNILFLLQIKNIQKPMLIIGVLGIAITAFHLWSAYHFVFTKKNNQHVFHFLTPVQYSLLAYFYWTILDKENIKKIISISIPVFWLVSFLISFYVQKFDSYNSYSLLLQNFLVTLWSLFYFGSLVRGDGVQQLEKNPVFYISAGIFFFSLSDFFIEGIMDYLIKVKNEDSLTLYYISEILSFILYAIFILAFLINKKYKVK